MDQQRAAEACERGDSAKEDKRGRNTNSAQLDGVKFPSPESRREQGSGVLVLWGGGQALAVNADPGASNTTGKQWWWLSFSFPLPRKIRSDWPGMQWNG